jgi:hypothetical protein
VKLLRRLLVPALALAAASCYGPQLGSPGFYCHADDDPPCPDGQTCQNGRCVDKGHGLQFDSGIPKDGGNTMGDMAHNQSNPDFAMNTGQLGCHGYVACLLNCAGDATCASGCDSRVTANGMTEWGDALYCGQSWCLGPNNPNGPGPGSGDCEVDITGTMLVDAFGTPTGTCNACLNNSLAMLLSSTCAPPNDPNCNPSMCVGSYQICLSDLP